MKILFIGQKGIPATFGGIEVHVDGLSRGLAEAGHDVEVYVRKWYTPKDLKRHHGVRLIHLPTLRTKHLDASIHSLLCSVHALFQRADIIHYHALGPTVFSILPRLFGKKVVSTVHRLDWDTEKWGAFARLFLKMGEYLSARVPHRTIVVSEDLRRYYLNRYGVKTVHVSHGVEKTAPRLACLIREKYGLTGSDYILFLGRIVPEKRVDWLIRSFRQVKRPGPDGKTVKLVIAGGSSATEGYVQNVKALSSGDPEILFTGFVTGMEKEELLSNTLLFVLPSRLEGFPIALMEAKGYGRCCLASDIPPHREAILSGLDGMLFDANRLEDLTLKLQQLLENPGKVEVLGENARKGVEQGPSWKNITETTETIYREILREGLKKGPNNAEGKRPVAAKRPETI